jgi:hypothetical protein
MPPKRPLMKLSRDEEIFVRHYKYAAEETVGTGEGLGSFDARAIAQICRVLTS